MNSNSNSASNHRPYCEDCAHYRPHDSADPKNAAQFATCAILAERDEHVLAVARVIADPPSPAIRPTYCSVARIVECGLEGKLFVAREVAP